MSPPLSAPARKKLARLLERCRPNGFAETLLAETGGEEAAQALVWEAIANDVVFVGDLHVRRFLLERPMSAEASTILAAHLARHEPPDEGPQWLPRWSRDVDTLVHRALVIAPAAFTAAAARYDGWARLGLAFARWRRGEALASGDAARIVTELARNTARGNVLGYAYGDEGLPVVDAAGAEDVLPVQTLPDLRHLAGRIEPGGGARFDEALAEATRENAWSSIADVEPALRAMPLAELVAQLAARTEYTPRPGVYAITGSTTYRMVEALDLLAARFTAGVDTPAAVFAAARAVDHEARRDAAALGVGQPAPPGDPHLLAMVLVVSAARRAGGDVPGDLEAIVSFTRVVQHPALVAALVEALRSLPAARVHGWMEAVLQEDAAAVAALGAHPDEAALQRVLTGFTPLVVEALAVLGAPALPTLLVAMNELPAERATPVRHAFVFALAASAAEGHPPPDDLDLELLVAAFDGRPMERERYGDALRAATERILNALPAARRTELLVAAYAAAPMSVILMLHALTDDAELTSHLGTAVVDGMVTSWVLQGLGSRAVPALLAHGGRSRRAAWVREQAEGGLSAADFARVAHLFVPGETWRAIEVEVAAAVAVDPSAPRVRVYLLAQATTATPAREGSSSRIGGRAPGLPAPRIPRDDDGEELTHILTIDLDDAPELRARYPRAAAIALFTPEPETGARVEDSVIVPSSPAKGEGAGNGRALAVFGIDVPIGVLADTDALEPPLRAVRDRIQHAGGHVFGRPFWIHGKPFSGDDREGFVMQIDDGLNDELNLGDGSLYVYESSIVAQTM